MMEYGMLPASDIAVLYCDDAVMPKIIGNAVFLI
jgi:hypothetical protein